MALFALPANSKVCQGKTWPASMDAKRVEALPNLSLEPDVDGNTRLDTFSIDLDRCGPMVLDGLFRIKSEIDSTSLSPVLPRGHLGPLLDAHQRRRSAGVLDADRRHLRVMFASTRCRICMR